MDTQAYRPAANHVAAHVPGPSLTPVTTGTDSSQGKPQIISNINACLAVQATIKSTLGPYGGDLLMVDENGRQTITNDGATVMKLLDIVHPAARILVDIARSQDAEVGDGTTSVVVLAGEILKEVKEHVEQGVSSQTIVKGLRRASQMAVNKVKEIAVSTDEANHRDTLAKLAGTAMTSKLIKRNTDFFTKSEQQACGSAQLRLPATVLTCCLQWLSMLCYASTKTTSTST